MKINQNLIIPNSNNDFEMVTKKILDYKKKNPNRDIISLGIGDVSRPIINPIIKAMHQAVVDLEKVKTFKGYGLYFGDDSLKQKILENEYKTFGFSKEEIYISNGAKTDTTSILELFDINSKILIPSIMYPIYGIGAKCLNRKIKILNITEKNNFVAEPPKEKYDLIYLCSPSNPIGIAYTYEKLLAWVNYAVKNKSIILYDNVYESFISTPTIPHSIYEIPNAKKVVIEFRSFSKKASFTGIRCSYYIIPNDIDANINKIWKKRVMNRFNGADYIVQKGAEAVYSKESQLLLQKNIDYYKANAFYLKDSFDKLGFKVWGGIDAPYLWIKIENGMTSWEWFDFLLQKLNIIVIPGIIFGEEGDKYFRVSSLGNIDEIKIAIERLKKYYEKEI